MYTTASSTTGWVQSKVQQAGLTKQHATQAVSNPFQHAGAPLPAAMLVGDEHQR